ncbi:MAG: hypothetical protein PVH88_23025 [Ignavibacteria bacterium]|jgi:hypothetical protein
MQIGIKNITKLTLVFCLFLCTNMLLKAQTLPSTSQTKEIFALIFDDDDAYGLSISYEDKVKAKLFITDLIDGSCGIALAKGALYTTNLRSLVIKLLIEWETTCEADPPVYYVPVKNQIKRSWKSIYEFRKLSGTWQG